ncbi:phospholipid phosphatase 2-like [Sapajus apella]|uniref:Phospholipid phosphatase 2-like n=1 Tax=Sapajus apella TaxID=9515 RepID=A0A6J3HEH1_SAPAP|nr:phospholipid phosphatase 2-like [Sapajus apella]
MGEEASRGPPRSREQRLSVCSVAEGKMAPAVVSPRDALSFCCAPAARNRELPPPLPSTADSGFPGHPQLSGAPGAPVPCDTFHKCGIQENVPLIPESPCGWHVPWHETSLPFAVLSLVNTPYKRGFYCWDDSIRYPYRPDTITHGLMAGATNTATVILVSVGEAYLAHTDRLYSRSGFNNYVAAVYKVLGTFLFGAAVSRSLMDQAKYVIGRLCPNFLAVFDPEWSRVNRLVYAQLERVSRGNAADLTEVRWVSTSSLHSGGQWELKKPQKPDGEEPAGRWRPWAGRFRAPGLVSELPSVQWAWECLAGHRRRRPHPSQLYAQAWLCWKLARLLRPTVQFFLVAFALYVGYTHVSDHKHHWSDVLAGLLQGALVAGLTVSF